MRSYIPISLILLQNGIILIELFSLNFIEISPSTMNRNIGFRERPKLISFIYELQLFYTRESTKFLVIIELILLILDRISANTIYQYIRSRDRSGRIAIIFKLQNLIFEKILTYSMSEIKFLPNFVKLFRWMINYFYPSATTISVECQ